MPETEQGRKVIFDIHCETDKGERIIIEMQNREQPHFKDRALYYLSHSVVEQGIKGTWDYELAAVYGVFFLNFTLDEENRPNNNRNEGKFRRDIVLADRETGQVFNPKFRQIYIELPRFNKEEEESRQDFCCCRLFIISYDWGCPSEPKPFLPDAPMSLWEYTLY